MYPLPLVSLKTYLETTQGLPDSTTWVLSVQPAPPRVRVNCHMAPFQPVSLAQL